MGKTFSARPSDLLDIEDPHDAFRLDRAVWLFGEELSSELKSVKGKNDKEIQRKSRSIMSRWIPNSVEMSKTKQFRDPAKEA